MGPVAEGTDAARCPTCNEPVETDWLTCRSCGAILAAVRRPTAAPAPVAASATAEAMATDAEPSGVAPGWPAPPSSPAAAEPPPPSTPPVHTAAVPAAQPPTSRPELGPNQWYSSRQFDGSAGSAATAASATKPPGPGQAGALADLPLAIPQTAGGRVAAVGLALIAVAFFLPWSPLLPGISLLDAWGFSRSSRVVVFLVDLVLLLLIVLPVGLSPRLRTGWLPALFGVFVVGVFWERVDAISVVGPGAWLFAIGGLVSLVGGLLTLLGPGDEPAESAEPPPT